MSQNEVTFGSIKEFKKSYYGYFVAMCRRLAKDGKVPAEHKDTLKDNLIAALTWIEANFDSLQVRLCVWLCTRALVCVRVCVYE